MRYGYWTQPPNGPEKPARVVRENDNRLTLQILDRTGGLRVVDASAFTESEDAYREHLRRTARVAGTANHERTRRANTR